MTVLFKPGIGADVTAIIGLTAGVSTLLPILISVAAIGSQFSASVADNEGAAGLIEEISEKKISEKVSYLIILAVTVTLTWFTDVTEIIAYASRMFALYYMLQCVVALIVARENKASVAKEALFGLLAVVCFFCFPSRHTCWISSLVINLRIRSYKRVVVSLYNFNLFCIVYFSL